MTSYQLTQESRKSHAHPHDSCRSSPADAVFYIQKGKVKITVVSEQGKEAVVAVLGPDASKRRARAKRFSLELNSWSTKSASTRIVRAKRLASVTGKRSSASARTIWGGPMNNTSIQNAAFDDTATLAMGKAFDQACKSLRNFGSACMVREIIAKRIINVAKHGERDPTRLHVQALEALGIKDVDVGC
jgi:hypothetical protein